MVQGLHSVSMDPAAKYRKRLNPLWITRRFAKNG
jgi:hypothetical protein